MQTEVVYPSTSSFSGTGQLNLGPFNMGTVYRFIRLEARGLVNFQGFTLSATGVLANWQLWAVYWVPTGTGALDVVTTIDGPQWLIREQTGAEDYVSQWAPSSDTSAGIQGYRLSGDWAGQMPINQDIDLWLSMRAPTGASIPNFNVFASLRFWWV